MNLLPSGTHPNITESIEKMLIDVKYKLPFYGQFNLMVNFKESKSIPTCGVNMNRQGMYFYYNSEFLNSLGSHDGKVRGNSVDEMKRNQLEQQNQINFIMIHEDFHLLFNHPQRTVSGRFDPHLSNVAQDMIINSIIWEDISKTFVSIPKYPSTEANRANKSAGKNMALFLPKEYIEGGGEPIFEELYNWLKKEKEKYEKKKSQQQCKTCDGTGKSQEKGDKGDKGKGNQPGEGEGQDGEGQGGSGQGQESNCPDCKGSGQSGGQGKQYGPYGTSGGSDVDTYSMENIFENMEEKEGQWMDSHMEDEIPAELRESMVQEVIERLKARGFTDSNVENTLNKLRKKRKDHLREIKRSISNEIMGNKKIPSITRPNRRGIKGVKGRRKVKSKINVLLDTSGSMNGMIEKVLEYIFQNDVEINICNIDTQVQKMETVSSMKEIQKMIIKGGGGTVLQPGIDLISSSKDYNKYNTVLLTDGWCDTLDMGKLNGRLLGITCGDSIPVSNKPRKGFKEIIIERTN